MPVVRVRQHVNPLSQKYQQPVAPPDWSQVFANPARPLHLDIGCGRGVFLLKMAQVEPEWNFLGLEIREPLVEQALKWRDEEALSNLHYIFCNASNSLEPLLRSLPPNILQRVSIQFPDPWFKKRHQKRRVVQPSMVNTLANHMPAGSVVFLQSDVEAVEAEMCDRFQEHPAFQRQSAEWLPDNPLPVATERESSTLARREPVFRALFTKKNEEGRTKNEEGQSI